MEYTQITSLVPEGENFDSTAVNEGVIVSEGHLQSIETRLSENATAINGHATAVQELNNQITEANTARDTAVNNLTTANQTIATKDEEITKLNNRITELQKQPGAEVVDTRRDEDEIGTKKKFDINESAASKFADRAMGKRSK